MLQELKPRIALLADAVWNTALQVLLSLDRSFAKKTEARLHIQSRSFRMQLNGAKTNGVPITEIKTESTVMIQALHHAKLPALLTLLFRDILKWLHRADILTLLLLSKKKIHFLLFAEEYVTDDARMPAQEELLTRQLQLTKLKDS